MNNSTGNNSNAPFARVPSAGGLPTLPGMNSSVSGQEDSNFPPGRILNQILIYSHILHQDQQMKIISKLHITPKWYCNSNSEQCNGMKLLEFTFFTVASNQLVSTPAKWGCWQRFMYNIC